MQEERIRLTSTDSANSVNRDAFVDVELQHHTKVFPFPSVSNTIDQRELFEQERADSTKYRLILTINPYCTNVLFNAVTEIVKNEGTDSPSDLLIASEESNPSNTNMVRNTQYSNEGYEYHCGFDIFNNHILRNQSFKVVNPITDKSHKYQNTIGGQMDKHYNTIEDIMRYSDGSEVVLKRRTNVTKIEGAETSPSQNYARHLYLKDDILSFMDSINANLSEQNGWWGFNNRSSIPSCKFIGKNEKKVGIWSDMKISKTINGEYYNGDEIEEHMACEFVEMYPDSTLYSFSPKYNRFQNREEQNWDVCIMYPYKSFGLDYTKPEERNKVLINGSLAEADEQGNTYVNGLLLADYKQTKGTSGQNIVLFRSYVKHNLNRGDKIKLFYNTDTSDCQGDFIEIKDKLFEVINVGNLKSDYLEYYFYINDVNDLKQALGITDEESKIEENTYTFRFVKVVNDRDCKYYYRQFRKLPNLRFKKEELTEEIVNDEVEFEKYINKNCRKTANSEMRPFNKEQYPLAFSRTIYNDGNTQITFTDTIDIDKFADNLGRPLTELFVTFIKRNKGHDIWYKKQKTANDLKNIEFSHCFGEVKSGLDVHIERSDDEYILNTRKRIGDCTLITNTDGDALDNDITLENKEKDILFGDVVELDRYNMRETVLSDVHFRFNTEQREHEFEQGELNCGKFVFEEIMGDDYDYDYYQVNGNKSGFYCEPTDADDLNEEKTTYRPEGYHYKAHYPIKVREFGSMRQGSHKDIKISSCKPKQANGMFIEVVSSLRSGVNGGDIVFLCDETEEIMIPLTVNSVQSNVRFLLNPMVYGSDGYKSVFEIVEGLLYSERTVEVGETWIDEYGNQNIAEETAVQKDYGKPKYILRLKDTSIPSYAYKVAVNTYLWRDVLNVGHKDTVELTEYPFANGHFYINKDINFFLERQDPFAYGGLYKMNKYPNDIFGNIKKESNYVYKDEEHRVC